MTLLLASVNAWANEAAPHGSAASAMQARRVTDKYTHGWTAFPSLSLKSLADAEAKTITTTKGRVLVVVFVASWCIPCQQLMPEFRAIAGQYKAKYTDLVYVFAHDAEPDARAFSAFHEIEAAANLGTAKVLEDFHQPDLPSVYVADRFGWLVYRKINIKPNEISELDKFLDLHTSF